MLLIEKLNEESTAAYLLRYDRDNVDNCSFEELYNVLTLVDQYNDVKRKKKEVKEKIERLNKYNHEEDQKIQDCTEVEELDQLLERAKAAPNRKELIPLKEDILNHKFDNPKLLKVIKNKEDKKDLKRMVSYGFYLKVNNDFSFIDEILQKYLIFTTSVNDEASEDLKKKYKKYDGHRYKFSNFFKKDISQEGYKFLCIYRGIKLDALNIKYKINRTTFLNIHRKLYHMFFKNLDMCGIISKFLNIIIDDLWDTYLRDDYYNRCLEKINTICKKRAVEVFRKYLPQLLYTKPVEGKVIMGIDPGYKNGCKCAIINANGRLLDKFIVSVDNRVKMRRFDNPPDVKPINSKTKLISIDLSNKNTKQFSDTVSLHTTSSSANPFQCNSLVDKENTANLFDMTEREAPPKPPLYFESINVLQKKINEFKVNIIAVGNGTASHKAQKLVVKAIENYPDVNYVIVDESGSSAYSVTPEAKEDNDDIDELFISALSLARRVSYPLSEYVKMKPNTLGIGQYQKDLDEKELEKSVKMIIDELVSKIGVDVNRANRKLLSCVSGINERTADMIYNYCSNNQITSRDEIEDLEFMDDKTYKMCAGFLTFKNSPEPLDNTIIHPYDYGLFYKYFHPDDIKTKNWRNKLKDKVKTIDKSEFNGNQKYILDYILNDPIIHLSNSMKQYHEIKCHDNTFVNCVLKGRVESITDFAAFIDVNLCNNAFLPKNEMTKEILEENGYGDELKIGDYVNVIVTYKKYKDLVFVDDKIDDSQFNRRYHELLGEYRNSHPFESDIGEIREGIVKSIEDDYATIELSKYQSGIMYKEDYPYELHKNDKLFVAIVFASIEIFNVKLAYK